MPIRRLTLSLLLAAGLGVAAADAQAQSLRGSRATVDRAYRQARASDVTFHSSGGSVRRAASRGQLVRLGGNANYRVALVSYPYTLPSTRTFVQGLAQEYRAACGERLVVTSATRPSSLRLRNSVAKTVHPAGMAVDLRKPGRSACLRWLRRRLLSLEGQGMIDATEERRPPHFHVVVFPGRAGAMASSGGKAEAGPAAVRRRSAARAAPRSARTALAARGSYRVRRGDSLWTIARRHDVSVSRLKSANGIRSSRVKPGQVLAIPAR